MVEVLQQGLHAGLAEPLRDPVLAVVSITHARADAGPEVCSTACSSSTGNAHSAHMAATAAGIACRGCNT